MEIKKTIMTQLKFEANTEVGVLSDAIYYNPDKPMTDKEIDEEIDKRIEQYEYIKTHQVENEPTKEDYERELASIEEQRIALISKISELSSRT